MCISDLAYGYFCMLGAVAQPFASRIVIHFSVYDLKWQFVCMLGWWQGFTIGFFFILIHVYIDTDTIFQLFVLSNSTLFIEYIYTAISHIMK